MNYTSIKVPNNLAKMVLESKAFTEYGYRSLPEFVIESARIHLRKVSRIT